jgi:hypothetical protein
MKLFVLLLAPLLPPSTLASISLFLNIKILSL